MREEVFCSFCLFYTGLALWVWRLPEEIWSSYMPRVPSPLATLQPLPGLTIIHQWLSWQGHSMLHVSCLHRALVLSLGPHWAFLPSVRSSLLPLYHHSFCRSTFGSPAPWDLLSAHTHTTSHWLAAPHLHCGRLPVAWPVTTDQFWSGPTGELLCYPLIRTLPCPTKSDPNLGERVPFQAWPSLGALPQS